MLRVVVEHHGVALRAAARRADAALGERQVRLARQAERIVEEAFLALQHAALDGERPADLVHALIERREHQRVGAVHELVVDRRHGHRLAHIPVAGREEELRRDRPEAAAVRADGHSGRERDRVGARDRQQPADHGQAVRRVRHGQNLLAERAGDGGEAVTVLHRVVEGLGAELQRPDRA